MHRAPIDEFLEGGADGSRTEAELRGDLLARHGLAREHQQTPNAAVDLLEAKGLEEGLDRITWGCAIAFMTVSILLAVLKI